MHRDLMQNLTADSIIFEDYYFYFMLPIESAYFNHHGDVFTVVDAFLSIRNSNYNYFTAKPMQVEHQEKLRKPR